MLEPAKTVQLFQKQSVSPKQFKVGEVIFQEGELGEYMYGILEGEVNLMIKGKLVETIKKGDIFGEGALVHKNATRVSTAVAKTNCTLAFLDQKHFLFAIQETPMFALEVMRSFSDRLRHLKGMI
ncbi:MAG: cyclic nucleotide-binding domain-containing protein [Microcoleaceae cyanobacterium]